MYHQYGFRVLVDTKCEVTFINNILPVQTKHSETQVKETLTTTTASITGACLKLGKSIEGSLSGIRDKETSTANERIINTSNIIHAEEAGVLQWCYGVDDKSDRQNGMKLEEGSTLLPNATFNYKLGKIPPCLDVEVLSYWKLEDVPTNSRLKWSPPWGGERKSKNVPKYSNLCQVVALMVPSHLKNMAKFYPNRTIVESLEPGIKMHKDSDTNLSGKVGVQSLSEDPEENYIFRKRFEEDSTLSLDSIRR
ncbi:hypothetical protein BDQ17DRAFT_915812 [Cyathus striatus]|nr:hypothetical protein BDQ17DRAFT_915812 [Cyathus striatus]